MASSQFLAAPQFDFKLGEWEDWLVVSEERPGASEDPMSKWPWYKERMNRAVAENFLTKSLRLDGTFLVRESDALSVRAEPVYMISVLFGGTVHHVEIVKAEDEKYSLAHVGGKLKHFKTLDKLVSHYQKKALDLEGGGSTKLKYILNE